MPAAETKRGAEGEFLAKDLSIWRQPPSPEADAGSGSWIQDTVTASKLWGVRERLLSVLVDLRRIDDGPAAAQQRDEINVELEAIYKAAPRTDSKAYAVAQDALKSQEEHYFSDRELDHLLPKELRRITPGSGDS